MSNDRIDEFEFSKDMSSLAATKANASFNFTARKSMFTNDQEIFVDSQYALVLVNDSNLGPPLPTFYAGQEFEKKTGNSQILSDMESSPTLKRSTIKKSTTRSTRSKNKGSSSIIDHSTRRPSRSVSNVPSDSQIKEILNESGSAPKSNQEDVDIFQEKGKENQKPKKPEWKMVVKMRTMFDSIPFNIVVCIFTLYTLFADDICSVAFGKSAETGFDVMSLICFIFFGLEILLTIYVKREYLFSFFFWLDVVSTVSILIDVNFISDQIFFSESDDAVQQGGETSLVATIGTRVGKVFRTVRLVRLVKFYKQIVKSQEKDNQVLEQNFRRIHPGLPRRGFSFEKSSSSQSLDHRPSKLSHPQSNSVMSIMPSDRNGRRNHAQSTQYQGSTIQGFPDGSKLSVSVDGSHGRSSRFSKNSGSAFGGYRVEEAKESRVGKKLSDLTTKRVIVIILGMLSVVPLFAVSFYFTPLSSQMFQMTTINILINGNANSNAIQAAFNQFISSQKNVEPPLVYLRWDQDVLYVDENVDVSNLRRSEASTVTMTTDNYGQIVSVVSHRRTAKLDAILSIVKTFFMFGLLVYGAVTFNNDAKTLILTPIERIIEKVNKIAKNPLLAKEYTIVKDSSLGFENETVEVENAIIKIGGLLALGFGDAGSAILTQNLANSGDVDPMLPGKKKAAIYGFCDIRNFTDATEILQEDVMIFVNSIAEVVHSMVDKYTGAANKNIGDAFLLVWKFPEDAVLQLADGQLEVISNQVTQNMADCALISFLKIYARINRDPTLLAYRDNPDLNARLPNYKVKMGFGLHVGWAIEGAIGSNFKIDASYLSPNVNMASRLEAATKQYGVPLLFSGDLYHMMSESLQEVSRLIDIVTVKGSTKPIELYTVDMDVEEISIAKDRAKMPKEERKTRQSQKKQYIQSIVENSYAYTLLETNKELKYILRNRNQEFIDEFNAGFEGYIEGNWALAKKKFESCLTMNKEDGPTKSLYRFLAEFEFIPPEDWRGYHVLTEK